MDIGNDDDPILAGGVKHIRNRTPSRLRYTSITCRDNLYLELIRDHADSLLGALHVVELFLILAGTVVLLPQQFL